MPSIQNKIVETKSYIRMARRTDETPKIYPVLPRGYTTEPEYRIWLELNKLSKSYKKEAKHKWIHFNQEVRAGKMEAVQLWKKIQDIKNEKWEMVWIIPNLDTIHFHLIEGAKAVARLAWRKKCSST